MTNITNITDSLNIVDLFLAADALTGHVIGILLLCATFLITYHVNLYLGATNSIGTATLITLLISIFFFGFGLINTTVLVFVFALGILTYALIYLLNK